MYKMIRLGILKTLSMAFLIPMVLYSAACCVHTHSTVIEFVRNSLGNLCYTLDVVFCMEYLNLVRMLKYRYEYFNGVLVKCFKKRHV
jgi:hypothetical protein